MRPRFLCRNTHGLQSRTKLSRGDNRPRLSSRAKRDSAGSNPRTLAKLRTQRLPSAILALALIAIILIAVHPGPLSAQAPLPSSPQVHIGVLGLFHPRELKVTALTGTALILHAAMDQIILERSSGTDVASIRISEDNLLIVAGRSVIRAPSLAITGRENDPTDFVLSVPGKLTRHYHGTLEIKPSGGCLTAIVTMDLETAVASVVAAESAPDTPLEALKAQAVATRSYFVASRPRHHDFDFCDTTHCQFLREPPSPGSPAAKAVAATRDMVLTYDSHPFAAMYTRSCSGHTHTPAELGLPSSAYPYYSVDCKYCRTHPERWSSRIPSSNAVSLHSSDESSRLRVDRRLGWSAVPSNDFTVRKDDRDNDSRDKGNQDKDEFILEGIGQGHGIGLCQSGAKAMAQHGATFREILAHYYPNTAVKVAEQL